MSDEAISHERYMRLCRHGAMRHFIGLGFDTADEHRLLNHQPASQ